MTMGRKWTDCLVAGVSERKGLFLFLFLATRTSARPGLAVDVVEDHNFFFSRADYVKLRTKSGYYNLKL